MQNYEQLERKAWVVGFVYSATFREYFASVEALELFASEQCGRKVVLADIDLDAYQLLLCEHEPLRTLTEDFFDTIAVYDAWELDDDIKDAMAAFNEVVEHSACNDVYTPTRVAVDVGRLKADVKQAMILAACKP